MSDSPLVVCRVMFPAAEAAMLGEWLDKLLVDGICGGHTVKGPHWGAWKDPDGQVVTELVIEAEIAVEAGAMVAVLRNRVASLRAESGEQAVYFASAYTAELV